MVEIQSLIFHRSIFDEMSTVVHFSGIVMGQWSDASYQIRPDPTLFGQYQDVYAFWHPNNPIPLHARVDCIEGGLPTMRVPGGFVFICMIISWSPPAVLMGF